MNSWKILQYVVDVALLLALFGAIARHYDAWAAFYASMLILGVLFQCSDSKRVRYLWRCVISKIKEVRIWWRLTARKRADAKEAKEASMRSRPRYSRYRR